jgi:predicted DNA binding CopG/RHH family protein
MAKSKKKDRVQPKRIPDFESEDSERAFWATHEVLDYFDWSKAALASFPELKPTTTSISLRLPEYMLFELKVLANQRDVPYQSLMKMFLAERLAAERTAKAS